MKQPKSTHHAEWYIDRVILAAGILLALFLAWLWFHMVGLLIVSEWVGTIGGVALLLLLVLYLAVRGGDFLKDKEVS